MEFRHFPNYFLREQNGEATSKSAATDVLCGIFPPCLSHSFVNNMHDGTKLYINYLCNPLSLCRKGVSIFNKMGTQEGKGHCYTIIFSRKPDSYFVRYKCISFLSLSAGRICPSAPLWCLAPPARVIAKGECYRSCPGVSAHTNQAEAIGDNWREVAGGEPARIKTLRKHIGTTWTCISLFTEVHQAT